MEGLGFRFEDFRVLRIRIHGGESSRGGGALVLGPEL